tara:strand:- start:677 stop:1381 length:705 start_codon:yes stop_codon:yes gene_type:complete
MKLVILAGGFGTRISEETINKPKPLVNIGSKPIIWHLMKIYSNFGINDFIICQGYKGSMLKKELAKYIIRENWNIKFVETGLHTMTGGRIKKIQKYIKTDEHFCLSYGDGLCNVNINKLINFHIKHQKIATLTAVRQQNRFGILAFKNKNLVTQIKEKPNEYINGGFFVLSKKIFKYLKNNKTIFEKDCLPKLAKIQQLNSFKHSDFWACMDTLRDKKFLNVEWKKRNCKWRTW